MLATCHRVRNSACSQLSPAHSAHHCHSSFPPPSVTSSPLRGGGRAAAPTAPGVSSSSATTTASSSRAPAPPTTTAFDPGTNPPRCHHRHPDYCAHPCPAS